MNLEVEAYFSALPPPRKTRMDQLHELIVELFPDAIVDMHYRMPTYRVGQGWVAIANQKRYVSLYTCGYHHIEAFSKAHPRIKTGKGCINFRDRDDLPAEDIRQVVRHAIRQPKPV